VPDPVPEDPVVGQQVGQESSLSNWAGPYVTEMLGRGWAAADMPYEAYLGPLTAGESNLQAQAFQGLAGLAVPENMGAYSPRSFTDSGVVQQYINPYLEASLAPQLEELRRQGEISRVNQAGQFTRAGAYGGSRQAVADTELTRAMLANMSNVVGQGYNQAFQQAQQQFNTEEQAAQAAQNIANQYGLQALANQMSAGQLQRAIEQEGITADRMQFEEERDFPYMQAQYMQSLLQGLPVGAQSYTYAQPSALSEFLSGSGGIYDLMSYIFLPRENDNSDSDSDSDSD
jgi:hypothetical protein